MRMLKGEIEILAAILLNKGTTRQLTTGRLFRYSPSIVLTLETLLKKGYIVEHKTKGYAITGKGIRTLAEFSPGHAALNKVIFIRLLRRQADEASRAIRMIEQLGSEYNIKINELQDSPGNNTLN
jgi:DNA-binding PadR family transcriptional regulator